jgi:hypothetical protein
MSLTTTAECPHCQQKVEAPEELFGQNVTCPTCSKEFVIPSPKAEASTLTPSLSKMNLAPPSAVSAPAQQRKTKPCPFCAEDILEAANKCKHCGADLNVPPAKPTRTETAPPVAKTKPCPFCGEGVMLDAKKCKHCGETIDVALRAAEDAKKSAGATPHVFMNAGGGGGGAAVAAGAGKRSFRHGLHLVLTILTCGLWFPIWVLAYLFRNREQYY